MRGTSQSLLETGANALFFNWNTIKSIEFLLLHFNPTKSFQKTTNNLHTNVKIVLQQLDCSFLVVVPFGDRAPQHILSDCFGLEYHLHAHPLWPCSHYTSPADAGFCDSFDSKTMVEGSGCIFLRFSFPGFLCVSSLFACQYVCRLNA